MFQNYAKISLEVSNEENVTHNKKSKLTLLFLYELSIFNKHSPKTSFSFRKAMICQGNQHAKGAPYDLIGTTMGGHTLLQNGCATEALSDQ